MSGSVPWSQYSMGSRFWKENWENRHYHYQYLSHIAIIINCMVVLFHRFHNRWLMNYSSDRAYLGCKNCVAEDQSDDAPSLSSVSMRPYHMLNASSTTTAVPGTVIDDCLLLKATARLLTRHHGSFLAENLALLSFVNYLISLLSYFDRYLFAPCQVFLDFFDRFLCIPSLLL
jgi:hypothetical protein